MGRRGALPQRGTKAWEQPATPTHPPTLWTAADACGQAYIQPAHPSRAVHSPPRGDHPTHGTGEERRRNLGADA
eukprot:scaffold26086_cov152-Isochrysis_galbana.AAC.1